MSGTDGALTGILDRDQAWHLAGLFQARSDLDTGTWQPEELSGFSLRHDLFATYSETDPERANQLVVESLVRKGLLYVQVTDTIEDGVGKSVAEYRFTLTDGRALPDWLRANSGGLLIGQRPADAIDLNIRIITIFDDGTTTSTDVTIQARTGEIQLAEKADNRAENGSLFSDQLTAQRTSTEDLEELAAALAQ